MNTRTFLPQPAFIPLNELDKLFYSWELFGYQAMARILFEFRGGHIDLALLRQAYAAEIRRRPVLNARIDDPPAGKGWQVRWKTQEAIDINHAVRICDFADLSLEAAEEKTHALQFDPLTGYSLRTDPAFFMVLCRMPGGNSRLLAFIHHGLADAHGISMILEELFAIYNQLAAGRSSAADAGPGICAVPSPLLPVKRRMRFQQALGALACLAARAISTGFKPAAKIMYGRHTFHARTDAVQRTISPQRLARYLSATKREGITFNVVLVAAQAMAIDRWKRARGEPCDLISMEVHQNLRTTSQEQELSNRFCPFIIDLWPRHRNEPKALLHFVRQKQEQALTHNTASKMICLLALLDTATGSKTQRLLQNFIFNNPRLGDSSLVTNLGKLWAGTAHTPPLVRLGDADITAYYMAGPPTPSIGSYFAYLAYNGSLFLTFNYFEWVMSSAEAGRFVDLFEETLNDISRCLEEGSTDRA